MVSATTLLNAHFLSFSNLGRMRSRSRRMLRSVRKIFACRRFQMYTRQLPRKRRSVRPAHCARNSLSLRTLRCWRRRAMRYPEKMGWYQLSSASRIHVSGSSLPYVTLASMRKASASCSSMRWKMRKGTGMLFCCRPRRVWFSASSRASGSMFVTCTQLLFTRSVMARLRSWQTSVTKRSLMSPSLTGSEQSGSMEPSLE
mmetsp:Transcript_25261/g.79267  ORF Transcript_25261/g.79267 Transcript_25261/m.79267 type:complete len:200 (-) Transcript_25261:921-1520(-)